MTGTQMTSIDHADAIHEIESELEVAILAISALGAERREVNGIHLLLRRQINRLSEIKASIHPDAEAA